MSTSRAIVNHNYSQRTEPAAGFKSFNDFYPFYLGEHCNKTNRRLHLFGTTNVVLILAYAAYIKKAKIIPLAVVQGYFWAWLGHFIFEKNKPATFRYPLWSLMGDWKMWSEVVSGKRRF